LVFKQQEIDKMKLKIPFKISCKEATYLHTLVQEGKMTFVQKIGFNFHLVYCKVCKKFVAQIEFLQSKLKNNEQLFELSESKKKEMENEILKNITS